MKTKLWFSLSVPFVTLLGLMLLPVAAQETKTTRVQLGSGDLLKGIPGTGPLKTAEIRAWLADPKNHEVLEIELPLGLNRASANISGLQENPMTRAKIELGRQLYFDKRLSADNTVSCADCHHPDEGFGRHTQFGVGIRGQEGNRNSPISYNRIVSKAQFWDGRAESLEAQAVGPIANPIEMGNTHEACVKTLKKIEGYQIQFKAVFGEEVTIDNVGKAIATFERAIVSGPAPYDYENELELFRKEYESDLADLDALKESDPDFYKEYMTLVGKAEKNAMSESAKRGQKLFFSDRVGCNQCHNGANFADELYHNLGIGMDSEKPDLGRFEVTKVDKDKGAFKTPTCRNVALSAPYMHDGSVKTLEEVMDWYAKGGHPNPFLSDKVKKFEMSQQDRADLVAFMHALTGEFPKIETSRLPE